MGDITDQINTAFRDFNTDGVPSSGDYDPVKSVIRALGPVIETVLSAVGAGLQRYATVALMNANTTSSDGQLAYVYLNNGSASDTANNVYQWKAATSSWVLAGWYYNAVAAVVQPLVTQAQNYANIAAGYASALQVPSQTIGRTATPVTGTAANAASYVWADAISATGLLSSVQVFFQAPCTAYIERWAKSGTTGTLLSRSAPITISAAGLKTLTPTDFGSLQVNAGEYIGINAQGGIGYTSETADGSGFWSVSGTLPTTGTFGSPLTTPRLQAAFFPASTITNSAFLALVAEGAMAAAAKAATDLLASNVPIGKQSTPVVGSVSTGQGIQVFPTPFTSATALSTLVVCGGTSGGTLTVGRWTLSGGTFTRVTSLSVTVAANVAGQSFDVSSLGPVQAGEYIGLQTASASVYTYTTGVSDTTPYYAGSTGSATSFTQGALTSSVRLEVQVNYKNQTVTAATVAPAIKYTTPSSSILCWGHSLVQGNQDGTGNTFPAYLAAALGRPVVNQGVSGQRAPDIGARLGSYPFELPSAIAIPASGSVSFTIAQTFAQALPLTGPNSTATIKGWLGGVYGTLSLSSYVALTSYTYSFTRAVAGSAVSVLSGDVFQPDISDGRDFQTSIFWLDRNSVGLNENTGQSATTQFNMVINTYDRAVRFLKTSDKRFLIPTCLNRTDEYAGSTTTASGSALNGDASYSLIISINEELKQRWPRNVVDVRKILVESYNPSMPNDVTNHGRDTLPPSLLFDNLLHPLAAGYQIISNAMQARLTQFGW